ncbi:MAG: permease-like cell division protein FtsX [Candidatus Symbiothrix sp.]|jgi:cell division transport system permease protein|nr:permease-like cell division protein FtsX [Candidatus Symbiothrix sp.]
MKRNTIAPVNFINSKITATVSIALVLFLLGLILLIIFFANNFSNQVKETLSVDIVMQDGTKPAQIKALQAKLEAQPFTKKTTFHSKEEAALALEDELGQNPEEFLGFNPLPDVIELHLNAAYASLDSLSIVKDELESYSSDIKNTEYREELLQTVNKNLKRLSMGLLILAALLMFISYVLINNTIRLSVYAKRFLIHTMQLVGAKKIFIMQPFILSNAWAGIVAAIVACGLLYGVVSYTIQQLPDMATLLDTGSLVILFISVLLLGVLISSITTIFAVNKYLDADSDELYNM